MPGICGILCPTDSRQLDVQLSEMLDQMRYHPWYREERYGDETTGAAFGRLSLGFTNAEPQPVWNEDRTLLAMMHGEIYNDAEQRNRLASAGHRFASTSHAELLVHGVEQSGKAFLTGLHGCFCAIIWDPRNRRVMITNDRFGMRPLYYATLPGKMLLASEIKSLLTDPSVSRAPDRQGIAQFLAFGQFLGDSTLLESVRAVPAAAWFTYSLDDDHLLEDRYWHSGELANQSQRSDAETLDAIDHAFEQAVARRTDGTKNLGISLSGGLDSRTILACVDPTATPITSVSMGIEGSLDHRCAERMAQIVKCRHHSCFLNNDVLLKYEEQLRQMVRMTDGHFLSQGIMQYTLPAYRELGIEVLLRGHAGELMHLDKAYSFSHDPAAMALTGEAELESWLMRHLSNFMIGELDAPMFADSAGGELEGLARASLRQVMSDSRSVAPAVQRISHIFVTQRLRRETALSMVEFGSLVETRMPFLDNDLVDLLLRVPPRLKWADRIQSHILRRRLPAFMDVVNANTGMRVGAGPTARRLGQFRLKLFAKLRVPGYQPYERLGLWLRRELRPLVEQLLLSDRCLSRGILNPDTLRKIVAEHCTRQKNHTYLIMALMILELGQQELFEARTNGPVRPNRQPAPLRVVGA
jgi:asparagine synthase (glutamine-hydrolysing)